ncbi:unnamed protein product [Peronospora belbahrii]|uniref:Fanconi-associated nuclease n=1 Tax=Peronospora belbahrii TaxID=622444 RepID=A0ABN8CW98_9STRA|nr:unnamed protein product [Peronospora belbahrii]
MTNVEAMIQTKEEYIPPLWEDAYARHLTLVLSSILFERQDFRHLFSIDEIQLASRLITDLKPLEQQLYARLLQRQGPWYKTTSLFRYFIQNKNIKIKRNVLLQQQEELLQQDNELQEQLLNNTQIQHTLRVMIDAGFFQTFPVMTATSLKPHMATLNDIPIPMSDMDTILDAIACCATASELATLYKKMTGSTKYVTKVNLMATIRTLAKTQRRIDGSRIPVAQLMHEIWLDSYPLVGRKSSDVMVLRMTPAIHRFDTKNASSLLLCVYTTVQYNVNDAATTSGECSSAHCHGNAQEYKVTRSRNVDDSLMQICNSHCVFPSSEAYVSYEVAYQLHRIMSIVEQCIPVVTPEKEYVEPDLELKWMLSDVPPLFLAFQRAFDDS